jgi:hypothetical protein
MSYRVLGFELGRWAHELFGNWNLEGLMCGWERRKKEGRRKIERYL